MNIIPDVRTLIVQLGGFLLVLLVFKLFLFKPILGILDARRNEVEGQFEDAETKRKAAEELKSDYEQHIAGIEDETRAKIADAVKDGQAMREEIIADSRAQADRILSKAQEEIQREKESAISELRTTVADLAVEAAGRLIRENLDNKKQRELVGRFIDNLGEVSK
ncbi:MAG: ATP synthase F0 subunit B [Armatimonadetes bacterium RBG_16_58_9]|nr:MAG: ATP synthase F0 subunit B [Armatimonadetes bacterium RBG_16_58_9]